MFNKWEQVTEYRLGVFNLYPFGQICRPLKLYEKKKQFPRSSKLKNEKSWELEKYSPTAVS